MNDMQGNKPTKLQDILNDLIHVAEGLITYEGNARDNAEQRINELFEQAIGKGNEVSTNPEYHFVAMIRNDQKEHQRLRWYGKADR